MLNISPIKLLSGTHSDTAITGSGCFMNVIAYLNGEPQITDQSPCVCVTVRPNAIWLNDFADDTQRQQLIPYIQRAMGSATEDRDEMKRRLALVVGFAEDCADLTARYAPAAAAYAAATAATAAAYAAYVAARAKLFDLGIKFLDSVLPPADPAPSSEVLARATRLCELQGV
jgi:hypothetical protein